MLETCSNKLKERAASPMFFKTNLADAGEVPFEFKFDFPNSNGHLTLTGALNRIGTDFNFATISYDTNVEGMPLAFLDATIELIQMRPVSQMMSISVKEVDYFLRDNNSTSAFGDNDSHLYRFFEFLMSFHHSIIGDAKSSYGDEKVSPDFEKDYLSSNETVYDYEKLGEFTNLSKEVKYDQVKMIFDRLIRPHLQRDGGDVSLAFVGDDMVAVTYSGACTGCGSALTSTMDYIQNVLRKELHDARFMVVTDS